MESAVLSPSRRAADLLIGAYIAVASAEIATTVIFIVGSLARRAPFGLVPFGIVLGVYWFATIGLWNWLITDAMRRQPAHHSSWILGMVLASGLVLPTYYFTVVRSSLTPDRSLYFRSRLWACDLAVAAYLALAGVSFAWILIIALQHGRMTQGFKTVEIAHRVSTLLFWAVAGVHAVRQPWRTLVKLGWIMVTLLGSFIALPLYYARHIRPTLVPRSASRT